MIRKKLFSTGKLPPYWRLAIFFFIFYTTQTTGQYIQIFLYSLGYSKTQIGMMLGTAGVISLLCQPVLGGLADASQSKKWLLAEVIGVSAVAFPALYFGSSWLWTFSFYTLYQIFFHFAVSLNTSLSVEYCLQESRPFGPLRTLGALSYSLMMFVIGWLTKETVNTIFLVFPIACCLSLIAILFIPDIRGGNRKNSGMEHVSPITLLQDKTILVLIAFQTLIGVFMGLGNSFFSIYFTVDMKGSTSLYGISTAVAALFEVPFLFLTDKWLNKLGPRRVLLMLCSFTALRNLLNFFAVSVGMLFAARCLNFFSVMESVTYSLILIRIVRPQLKTSAQTLSATVQSVANLMVSSYLGGYLSDLIGIRPMFAISAVGTFAVAVLFTQVIFKRTIDPKLL